MTDLNIPLQRLSNQRLSHTEFTNPVEVIQWLGAVQSQDYTGARWAVGLRMHGMDDAAIDKLFNDGAILRTHVPRPTWHFIAPEDIRWMLMLLGPRVHQASAYMYRTNGLDDALFARSNETMAKALQGGKQLTREELALELQRVGIESVEGFRLTYLVMVAELTGVICSGPKRGKQYTYALLDERAPNAKTMSRDEALAELTKRYFRSHGPATLKDFSLWSGLTITDAKAGVAMLGAQIVSEKVDGKDYWFAPSVAVVRDVAPYAYLLSNYDEYIGGSSYYGALPSQRLVSEIIDERLFVHAIVIDGAIAGMWRRTFEKNTVVIEPKFLRPLTDAEQAALNAAALRYGEFMGLEAVLQA
ncbi:MAG: AlkZ family DNA glycosylase [Burkholderiales bacterium]|nr:AlkZ family DNA glycosylase [Anaerolineae bacterium]